ncbi:MAG TPA: cupin domain-containing protein [Syntrophorhabdales bacterium]|nr:cupin domain-containing protein [Syntrophorhabdales bacterium]
MKRVSFLCTFFALCVLCPALFGQGEKSGTEKNREAQASTDIMKYVRKVDFAAIERSRPGDRITQVLFDRSSGAKTCRIECIKTPAGGGSPEGLHTHLVDQIFYILKGTMTVEINGIEYEAGPGTLVIFPAGVAHRNWNRGSEPTVHLSFIVPMPQSDLPFATRVKP